MKKILFFLILAAALAGSCSPKAGEKAVSAAEKPKGTAPAIPIPSGADVRSGAPQAGAAPKIQIGKAETFQLDNGLKVILVENHKLPRVSFRVFVDHDPVLEKDAAGYVNMMGELLSKGTATRSKSTIDEAVDFIGATLSSDNNGVSGACLTKHTDKLLELMSDVLLNPAFPQDELDKAKRRAESGLASAKDDPNTISANVSAVMAYGKSHPYGEVMTEETLAKISLDKIKAHYQTFFKPNISYLVVVGDITRAQTEQLAKKYFSKWQKGETPTFDHGIPRAPEKTQVDFVNKPGAVQSVINITYPLELTPADPDVIRARVMNTILGGYFNSRVNANLREGRAYTYGARTSLSQDKLVGVFSAGASVRNAVTDSAIIEFFKELNRMRVEKVSKDELQTVKNVLTGQFSQNLEQPGTVANFALNTARYNLPADYYEKYLEVLQNVTPEEVLAMAKKYIRPERAHVVVVGNREEVSDKLKIFSPEGKVNFYDMYGNPDKAASIAIPAGVTPQTILNDYIAAIGGKTKIAAIKDLETVATMNAGGPVLQMKTSKKDNKKVVIEISMNGQVVSKQITDGATGIEYGMGGASRPVEGENLADLLEQAKICPEMDYESSGCQLTLKGVESVNGKNAYVLEVVRPNGKKTTEYYDMATSLKIREMSTQTGPDGAPVTVTNDFLEYKAVNDVKIPHVLNVGGIFPIPLKAEIQSVKVNSGLENAIFEIK